MCKLIGLSVWGLFIVVATLIVETVFGGVPLWVMILVAVALGAVAIPLMFGREIKGWYKKLVANSPNLPGDLIPLIDGIAMAWSKLRHDVKMLQKEDVESDVLHRFFVDEMLGGDGNDVSLYAVRPLFNTPEMINHPTDYVFSDDGKTAVHVQNEGERLTDLQVRRKDVKRWVKNYLRRVDEEIQQNEEAPTDG